MKVEVVNYSWNLSSLFNGKELVHSPNTYDTKTFWSKIVWANTLKVSSLDYDGIENANPHDIIQVLHPVRKYHFGDACVCFTKDADSYSFMQQISPANNLITNWSLNFVSLCQIDPKKYNFIVKLVLEHYNLMIKWSHKFNDKANLLIFIHI